MSIIITIALLTVGMIFAVTAFFEFIESDIISCIVSLLVAVVSIVAACCVAIPESKEQTEKDKTPRVIREIDGCKVYQFLGDNSKWYYFTRCENNSTVTSSTHTECQLVGKVNTCKDVITDIETVTTKK